MIVFMSELIYLDANVYLDYYLQTNSFRKDVAFDILRRVVLCEFRIAISEPLLFELEKKIKDEDLREILFWLKPKTELIRLGEDDIKESKKYNIHYPDNLHFHLAKKHRAVLVSNDWELQEFGAILPQVL